MKTQALATQNYIDPAGDTINNMMEECEMKATNAITTLNTWLRKTPGKLLGALAVGGLIITAAVVTPSSAFADEPSRPLSIEASQGFGPIHDMAEAALLATASSRTSKLDTRLHTNWMDFAEDSPIVDRYDRSLLDSEFGGVAPVAPAIVDRYDRGLLDSEFGGVAPVAPAIVDRYDRGLLDSEFGGVAPVAPAIVGRYDRGLFDEVLR